jgi:hypothetical protein
LDADALPLHIRSTRKLTLKEAPVVTVIGKAFFDIGHAPKDSIKRKELSAGVRGVGNSSRNGAARRARIASLAFLRSRRAVLRDSRKLADLQLPV